MNKQIVIGGVVNAHVAVKLSTSNSARVHRQCTLILFLQEPYGHQYVVLYGYFLG